ncbi:MAG: polysulfide reductase NrfD [Deltaproteobacteria bacterium]|nr:polysulfide reductase NrfD [Deltaproteobacteria bacterium]
MKRAVLREEIIDRIAGMEVRGGRGKITWVLVVLVVAGVVIFVSAAFGSAARQAWQVYLVNFLFWSGMAQMGLVFCAILSLTKSRWGWPIKRLAEATAAFLPISFVLFLVLIMGRGELFHWIHEPVHGREAWLNAPFLFTRDGIALALFYGCGLAFLYYSWRIDLGLVAERTGRRPAGELAAFIMRGWRGIDEEMTRAEKTRRVLAPILALLYACVLSLIAFDLVMSLSPHWYSSLFGAYYFISTLDMGFAALIILSLIGSRFFGLDEYITPGCFHDLGKLLLAFTMLWAYFFYSQYLIIWYGNLPEEARYVILRTQMEPWKPLAFIVLAACFVIPFLVLLSRKIKNHGPSMIILCLVVLVGMWLERYILVVPSITNHASFGVVEVGVTAGFFGLASLSWLFFMRHMPAVSLFDPGFPGRRESLEGQAKTRGDKGAVR